MGLIRSKRPDKVYHHQVRPDHKREGTATMATAPNATNLSDVNPASPAPTADAEALANILESIARPFPVGCNWEDQARACQIVAEHALSSAAAIRKVTAAFSSGAMKIHCGGAEMPFDYNGGPIQLVSGAIIERPQLQIRWSRVAAYASFSAIGHDERVEYEQRILALEMDIERLKKGEQPIYAGMTAREIAMGTYHPGDEA